VQPWDTNNYAASAFGINAFQPPQTTATLPMTSREPLDKRHLDDMVDRPDSKRGRYSFLD